MKKLVAYYSMGGSTRLVAGAVAEAAGADLLELVPRKEFPSGGFKAFFRGGSSAFLGERPDLRPQHVRPEDYDFIFIGTPVWAWTFSPPVRTFLSQHDFSGKRVALFCCHGGQPGKVFRKMRAAIPGAVFLGELALQEPRTNDTGVQLEKARQWAFDILRDPC